MRSENDFVTQRLRHCFGLRVHVQLFVDLFHVKRDRVHADAQLHVGGIVVVTVDEAQHAHSRGVRALSDAGRGWKSRNKAIMRRATSGDIGRAAGHGFANAVNEPLGGVFFTGIHAPPPRLKDRSSSS
jgi:hypothetical protein